MKKNLFAKKFMVFLLMFAMLFSSLPLSALAAEDSENSIPQGDSTRAEVATMLQRFVQNVK